MKRVMLLILVAAAGLAMGAGEFGKYDGPATFTVTTDDGGDSTLAGMTRRIAPMDGWSNSVQAMFVLRDASPAYAGLGVSDSGFIQLFATFGDSLHILTADTVAALPCTTYYASTADIDTLLKEYLTVTCSVFDTLGDSAFVATYPLDYHIILK